MKEIKFASKERAMKASEGISKTMTLNLVPRDPKRIPKILDALEIYWEKQPDTRLGQLLMNVAFADGHSERDCFYYEDSNLLNFLENENHKKFLEENGNKGL